MTYNLSISHWLSAGIIGLLVAGTLSAKTVFLVDNDLERQTELSGKAWQLDANSAHKYTTEIEHLAAKYIDRLTQLPARQAWCGSSTEISLVLAKAKSLHLIEFDRLVPGQADIVVKLPRDLSLPNTRSKIAVKNLRLYVNPALPADRSIQSWCIASGRE